MINIELFKRYDFFKDKELLGLTLLKNQGFNNTNYLLLSSKENYLIRVFNASTNTNRNFEFKTALKAFKKGIGAKPLILDIKNSLMICEFLEGSHKHTLKKIDIKNLALLLKKLHTIPSYAKPLNLHKTFNSYSKKTLNKEYFQVKQTLKILKSYKKENVLCHHDLNIKNILFAEDIKLIDWEYARVNDKYFDLASLIIEFDFNKQEELFFVLSYFKSTHKCNSKKLYMYKMIYKSLCKLWFDAKT